MFSVYLYFWPHFKNLPPSQELIFPLNKIKIIVPGVDPSLHLEWGNGCLRFCSPHCRYTFYCAHEIYTINNTHTHTICFIDTMLLVVRYENANINFGQTRAYITHASQRQTAPFFVPYSIKYIWWILNTLIYEASGSQTDQYTGNNIYYLSLWCLWSWANTCYDLCVCAPVRCVNVPVSRIKTGRFVYTIHKVWVL